MVVILEQKLFQNASSKLVFEASILDATSVLRITHLNSLETETQHVSYFGEQPHNLRAYVFIYINKFTLYSSSHIFT
jgi:hypothetical protein